MTRLNVRIRQQLFRSLMHQARRPGRMPAALQNLSLLLPPSLLLFPPPLAPRPPPPTALPLPPLSSPPGPPPQDAGFFDTTKTGEVTSRLSADTTTVSDQICLNLNVMLRSSTQAAMVLVFMFSASWRLTVVTFVMIPLVLVICKLYGAYYRRMSKKARAALSFLPAACLRRRARRLTGARQRAAAGCGRAGEPTSLRAPCLSAVQVQTELAEANSVAEEALSSMTTVKAHAAEDSTMAAYAAKLTRFYHLQRRWGRARPTRAGAALPACEGPCPCCEKPAPLLWVANPHSPALLPPPAARPSRTPPTWPPTPSWQLPWWPSCCTTAAAWCSREL